MPSTDYRYFCLDSTGKLHGIQWLKADSDEEAVACVEARHPDGKCEVWQDKRLVATFGSGHKVDIIADSYRTIDKSLRILRDTSGMIDERNRRA